MGDAIGGMLASAIGIAISPLPLIAVVLMLATPRGRLNGTSFTVGWIVALAATVTIVVSIGSGLSTGGGTPAWASWLKLALGLLFLVLAYRQWHSRPRAGEQAAMPGWMRAIDRFTPAKAAGLAVVLVVANPKNLVLAIGGAVSIALSPVGAGGKVAAGALLVLIGSLCTLAPLTVYLLGGKRSAGVLAEWKSWMAEHNSAIMVVLFLVLGVKYVGDALIALV